MEAFMTMKEWSANIQINLMGLEEQLRQIMNGLLMASSVMEWATDFKDLFTNTVVNFMIMNTKMVLSCNTFEKEISIIKSLL